MLLRKTESFMQVLVLSFGISFVLRIYFNLFDKMHQLGNVPFSIAYNQVKCTLMFFLNSELGLSGFFLLFLFIF